MRERGERERQREIVNQREGEGAPERAGCKYAGMNEYRNVRVYAINHVSMWECMSIGMQERKNAILCKFEAVER